MQSSQLFLVLFLVLAIVAIFDSPQKRKTALLVLGSIALGIGIGAAYGLITGKAAASGLLASMVMLVCGSLTSISQIVAHHKKGTPAQKP